MSHNRLKRAALLPLPIIQPGSFGPEPEAAARSSSRLRRGWKAAEGWTGCEKLPGMAALRHNQSVIAYLFGLWAWTTHPDHELPGPLHLTATYRKKKTARRLC
jgi:hypothetical protein